MTTALSSRRASWPDLTTFSLYGALALGLTALGAVAAHAWDPPHTSDLIELTLGTTLLGLGVVGAMVAIRGRTYSEDHPGPWYRAITREGWATLLVVLCVAAVTIARDVVAARRSEADARRQQATLSAQYKLVVDSLNVRLRVVGAGLDNLASRAQGLSKAEQDSLSRLRELVRATSSAAAKQAEKLNNDVDNASRETSGLIFMALGEIGTLTDPDTGMVTRLVRADGPIAGILTVADSTSRGVARVWGVADTVRGDVSAVADDLRVLREGLPSTDSLTRELGEQRTIVASRDTTIRILREQNASLLAALRDTLRARPAPLVTPDPAPDST